MKKNTWDSTYREQKYQARFENQRKKVDSKEREIVVLLDVQGTLDQINDKTCSYFMKQLDYIRRYFKAGSARIVVSSYAMHPKTLKPYLEMFANNLLPNIFLEDAYFRNGRYNYAKDEVFDKEDIFNLKLGKNKFSKFEEDYLARSFLLRKKEVVWFAMIDDSIDDEYYKKYQNQRMALFAKPSQHEMDLTYANFMSRVSCAKGFPGVIEIFDSYLQDLRKLPCKNVMDVQKDMLVHLSRSDVIKICEAKDFGLLLRYLEANRIDDDDYREGILDTFLKVYHNFNPEKEELLKLKEVLRYVGEHLKRENIVFSLMLDKKETN